MVEITQYALKGQKALKLNAFALSGRLCCIYSKTQGAALG